VRVSRLFVSHETQDAALCRRVGVADRNVHQETIELCFWQGIGALLLDWVLRRHHEEEFGKRMGRVASGNLALAHRLEERGLDLRGSTVDFVSEDEVVEDRTGLKMKARVFGVIDLGTRHVGGQQIGSELDAMIVTVDRIRESLDGTGLRESRGALDEEMPVGQQGDEQALSQPVLTDHFLVEMVLKSPEFCVRRTRRRQIGFERLMCSGHWGSFDLAGS